MDSCKSSNNKLSNTCTFFDAVVTEMEGTWHHQAVELVRELGRLWHILNQIYLIGVAAVKTYNI